ncbi:hypothetical protein [Cystobacter ferrugineus]|uniref:Outer membrane protein beta-barrel domain-containing protein n=1 Tax=Cystobacter ferrugineus TaxID=83449 RepID=A0A1L9BI61_9BACT|nr:hypothetical protein [Cystobacter ferrugineus]OJH41848.1 hypothetical protein BON30_00990 [Cystobacter ferrugineus]
MAARLYWTLSMVASLGFTHTAWAQELDERLVTTGPATTTPLEQDSGTSASKHGLQLALSANLSLGAGYVYKNGVSRKTGLPEDLKITDASKGSLPILLEVGYRASPRFYLGLWGSYEKVFTKTSDLACPEGFDCSTYQWRFGPEARYHFAPDSGFDPWVGLGVGMEILNTDVEGRSSIVAPGGTIPTRVQSSVTDRGPTYARVSVGGDVALTRSLSLGPILTASIGSYTVRAGEQTVSFELPPGVPNPGPQTAAMPPADDGFHAYFTLGVRVVFLPL